jgi:hypothetical protein
MSRIGNVDLSALRALSKEERQALAYQLRTDKEVWNALNGLGGLSNTSPQSRLQGQISHDDVPVVGANLSIKNKTNDLFEAKTNQDGFFSIDLEPNNYKIIISSGNLSSDEIVLDSKAGVTSSLDYDFKEAEKAE